MPVENCPIYDPNRHRCVDVPLSPARKSTAKKPPRVLAFSRGQIYTKLDAYNFGFLSLLGYDKEGVDIFFRSLLNGGRPLVRPEPGSLSEYEIYSPVLCRPSNGRAFLEGNWQRLSTARIGTQAILAIRESELIIAFRGTELIPKLRDLHEFLGADMITDIDSNHFPAPAHLSADSRSLLHRGFLEAFEEVREDLDAFLGKHHRIKVDSIKICGHSLGGALAALCAVYLARKKLGKVLLYTFGQPRVGNVWFCKEVDSLSNLVAFRLDNLGDPVPHVPPPIPGPLLDLPVNALRPILRVLRMEIRPNRIIPSDYEALKTLASTTVDWTKGVFSHFGTHVPLAISDRGIPGVVVNGAQEVTLTTFYLTPEEEEVLTGSVPSQISHHSMFQYMEIVQGDLLRFLGFLYENRDLRADATYEFHQRQSQLVELRKELERRRELWRPNARGIPPTQLLSRTIQEIEWMEAAFERSWSDGNGKSSDRIWLSIFGDFNEDPVLKDELRLQWEQRVRTAQERVQEFEGQKMDLPNIEKVKTLMRDAKAREAEVPDLAKKVGLYQW